MIKKVNKNKFGVIEYSITNAEDLVNLPKGDTDNSVYAVDDNNNVYLYSKKANDYILINGGGLGTDFDGLFIMPINMGTPAIEVDSESLYTNGYYTVTGAINGNELHNSLVHFEERGDECILTLYEHCKFIFGSRDGEDMVYEDEELFPFLQTLQTLQTIIGNANNLPSGLQGKTLVEIVTELYNSSRPS